ncbi:hypothetical protein [Pseudoxanthomonas composti]|uniref:hypothetical protein n=1 Tax=Pseudoxanthomonas composti TaxID=2137479 RepID=UPI001F50E645|nr:hypothetical protein [Pseudoxanthomonas composti]
MAEHARHPPGAELPAQHRLVVRPFHACLQRQAPGTRIAIERLVVVVIGGQHCPHLGDELGIMLTLQVQPRLPLLGRQFDRLAEQQQGKTTAFGLAHLSHSLIRKTPRRTHALQGRASSASPSISARP